MYLSYRLSLVEYKFTRVGKLCFLNVLPYDLESNTWHRVGIQEIVVKSMSEEFHRHEGREYNGEKVFVSLFSQILKKQKRNIKTQ